VVIKSMNVMLYAYVHNLIVFCQFEIPSFSVMMTYYLDVHILYSHQSVFCSPQINTSNRKIMVVSYSLYHTRIGPTYHNI